jgi:hypothetical protein
LGLPEEDYTRQRNQQRKGPRGKTALEGQERMEKWSGQLLGLWTTVRTWSHLHFYSLCWLLQRTRKVPGRHAGPGTSQAHRPPCRDKSPYCLAGLSQHALSLCSGTSTRLSTETQHTILTQVPLGAPSPSGLGRADLQTTNATVEEREGVRREQSPQGRWC